MDDDVERDVFLAVMAGLGAFAVLALGVLGLGLALLLMAPSWQQRALPVSVAATATATPAYTPTATPVLVLLPVVLAPEDTATPLPSATPTLVPANTPTDVPAAVSTLPPSATPAPTWTATAVPLNPTATLPVFLSGGLGQPRAWWVEHFGPQVEIYGMPGYGDFNVLFMPGDRAGQIERQFDPEISLDAAQAMAAALLPSDARFVERYSPPGRPEAIVDVYLSASLAQNYPDASEWEYYPPGQFIVLYKVFEPGVARFVVGLGNNP